MTDTNIIMKRIASLILMALLMINNTLLANGGLTCETDSTGQNISRTDTLSKRELRKLRVAKRNFHYNILAGPSYTPDMGALIGGSALMTFRMNPKDKDMQRSVVPITLAYILNGGVNVGVKPQFFFKGDKFRIFGQFKYNNTKENFYGIGYDTNKNYVRSDSTSEYTYSGVQLNPWFLFRMGDSNFFFGPQIDITYDNIKEPAKYMIEQPDYVAAGGDASGYKNFSTGIGLIANYDSRDIPANSYKGIYLDIRACMYQKFLGGNTNFYKAELDYRQYKSVGLRKVLTWAIQSKNAFGDIPLNNYVLSGTPFDLRGYYMGQYRDKSSHIALMEYRHMFNTDKSTWLKKIIHHLGFVAWGGCGFMGKNPVNINGVLPNAGVGLRIEVQPRMNIRLDLGRNFVNNQSLFYFNMTEAF